MFYTVSLFGQASDQEIGDSEFIFKNQDVTAQLGDSWSGLARPCGV